MKVRFNTFIAMWPWDDCTFCQAAKAKGKYTIRHNRQKLIRKLCAACARHLNEFGDDDDFERLRR